MTAEQLKASIISFATSGELTAEWRELHGRSIEEWKYSPLSKICHSMRYGTAKKSLEQGKVIVLRMGNLQKGEIDWTSLVYTNDDEDIGKYSLNKGDILFNRTNSPELVGKTSIYRGEYPAIFAGYIIKLDYDRNIICGEYLNFVMNSQEERDFCARVKTNGVCQSNINAKKIGEFVVPIPPLEEQREIVERLNEILPLIEEYGKAHSALKKAEQALPDQLRASLLQEAIQGKLVPQLDDEPAVDMAGEEPDEVPFAIPEKWKWVKLGDCIKLTSGRDLEKLLISETPAGVPYITGASQIEKGEIIVNRWTSNPAVISQKGDLLLTCKGTVGKVAINNLGELHIARQIMAMTPKSMLELNFLRMFMLHAATGLSNVAKSMIPGISRKDVLELPIPLPPLAEQRRIVARLEELLPHVDAIESHI